MSTLPCPACALQRVQDGIDDATPMEQLGYIYLAESPDNRFKVGTSVHPHCRVRHLGQRGMILRHSILAPWSYRIERWIHQHFALKRIAGEWYRLDTADVETFPALVERYRPSPERIRELVRAYPLVRCPTCRIWTRPTPESGIAPHACIPRLPPENVVRAYRERAEQ